MRSQVKNVQMNVKQHVLGASKNEQTRKSEKKRTEKKRNKEIMPFFPLY
jgi:hypothetical protein